MAGYDAHYFFLDQAGVNFESMAIGVVDETGGSPLAVAIYYTPDVDFDDDTRLVVWDLVDEAYGGPARAHTGDAAPDADAETNEFTVTYTFDGGQIYQFVELELQVPVPDGYQVLVTPDRRSVFLTNSDGVTLENVLTVEGSRALDPGESILGFGLANGQRLVGDAAFTGTAEEFVIAIGPPYEERDGTATEIQMPDFGGTEAWTSYVDVPAESPLAMDFTTVVFDYNSDGSTVLTINAITNPGGTVPGDLDDALQTYVAEFNAANFGG